MTYLLVVGMQELELIGALKTHHLTYAGPIRLRQGLGQSKNVVMVRAMRAMWGLITLQIILLRFGFPNQNIDRTESLALGSPSFTPMQMARGFAVMANGGYLIEPYFYSAY